MARETRERASPAEILPALTVAISRFRPRLASTSTPWDRAIAETLRVLAELIAREADSAG
ncbi:hypothetical protein [Reyranella sp.]|jgi:hypothetical protein|uniref:hypothetical protein n=1 Tax=Reyranella sp. TaxID=1929291 RepID=UPI002F93533D